MNHSLVPVEPFRAFRGSIGPHLTDVVRIEVRYGRALEQAQNKVG